MRSQFGRSLIELVMTLAILAVVAAWMAPTFSALIRDQRLSSATNQLVTDLNVARNTAITRSRFIVLCASSSGRFCDAVNGYSGGWIIFEDRERDGQRASAEPLLLVRSGIQGVEIAGNRMVAAYIGYDERGLPRTAEGAFQAGTISVCQTGQGRFLVLSRVGRLRTERGDC